MTRTPCSDKNGVKKGTWTPEEDKKLIAYVTRYGFWNWRLLPKFAGLARCGKSCRLRWMNYLRPDIKRGNYSKEEEETIIRLHEKLGNRWSAIASHLPGRTDNEIKNYWHTTLKKRLPQNSATREKPKSKNHSPAESRQETSQSAPATDLQITDISSLLSPQSSSSCITADTVAAGNENLFLEDEFAFLDTDFWTEPYVADISYVTSSEEALAYLVTEPEYANPVCDATEIWSHGASYEEYTGLF